MSWKRNPYEYLYGWIVGMRDEGFDHEQIMEAFKTCPTTKMDANDQDQLKLADVIIRHALGQASDQEIEMYCHPTEVIGFKQIGKCAEGYIFMAHTTEDEDDFHFLVEEDAIDGASSLDEVRNVLMRFEEQVCRLLLYKSHTQSPYGVTGMSFQTAAAKLTWRDFSS